MSKIQDTLLGTLDEFKADLRRHGCADVRNLTTNDLTNDIHPLFSHDRWATGAHQCTQAVYSRILPALQLASRLLLEDCTLGWFCHVAYGVVCQSSTGKEYLACSKDEKKPHSTRLVKQHLEALARVVGFGFEPSLHPVHNAFGACYGSPAGISDTAQWPSIEKQISNTANKDRGTPSFIVLHPNFRRFFNDNYASATPSTQYRTMFTFAQTLVHEVAHAYAAWLGHKGTILYSINDTRAELGYSWEKEVLGEEIWASSVNEIGKGCSVLISTRSILYRRVQDRDRMLRAMVGGKDVRWKSLRLSGEAHPCEDPIMTFIYRSGPYEFHGPEDQGDGLQTIHCLYAIPMKWIMAWFKESEWQARRRTWEDTGEYSPPKLPDTFILKLERVSNGNRVERYCHHSLDASVPQSDTDVDMMDV
ncbi:unnamed protein product [Periconia digitata]|uniref:Uncharacterized protein n=1 Tax=Periconia digitata TaxID=1303443 RepID=A0A9W4UL49_9PLEO|nr:unnamed protein product [Periconia digitata]